MYIVMICVEICTIYFFYPETQGRTLEELAFCEDSIFCQSCHGTNTRITVFEDESLAEKAAVAVEKTIHHESIDDHPVGEPKMDISHIEVEAKPKGI